MNPIFEIEGFTLSGNTVKVDCMNGERYRKIDIRRDRFETWLRLQGKLDYTLHQRTDTIHEKTSDGMITLEEYWDLSHNAIERDLQDFIIRHHSRVQLAQWFNPPFSRQEIARNINTILNHKPALS